MKNLYDLNFSEEIRSLSEELEDNKNFLTGIEKEVFSLENKEYNYPEIPEPLFSEVEKLDLERVVSGLKKQIEDYKKDLEVYDSKKELLKGKEDSVDSNKKILEDKLGQFKETEDSISEVEEELAKSFNPESSLSELKSSINTLSTNLDKARSEAVTDPGGLIRRRSQGDKELFMNQNTKEQSNLDSLLERKTAMESGVCPECGKPYTSSEISGVDNEIQASKNALVTGKAVLEEEIALLEKNEKEIDKRSEEIELYKESVRKIETLEANLQSTQTILDKRETELKQAFDKAFEKNSERSETLKEKLHKIEDDAEVYTEKLNQSTKELDYLLKEKLEVPVKPELDVYRKIETVEEEIARHFDILSKIEALKKVSSELDKQRVEDDKALIEKKVERDMYQTEVNSLEEAIKLLKTNLPQFILVKLTKVLEDLSNHFLQTTYEGRYELKFVPTKDSLKLVYGPKEVDVKLASGYEQQVFSTAFKVALSNGISNKCLILDEVDSQASQENSEKLFRFLAGTLGTFFDQLIIVTHKPVITDMLEHELAANLMKLESGKIVS